MSDDHELLELAAKARGGIKYFNDAFRSTETGYRDWNPITDDGDAFRLAMKLGIGVYETVVGIEARKGPDMVRFEPGKEPQSYRRAIVRVAAAIAKANPSSPDL